MQWNITRDGETSLYFAKWLFLPWRMIFCIYKMCFIIYIRACIVALFYKVLLCFFYQSSVVFFLLKKKRQNKKRKISFVKMEKSRFSQKSELFHNTKKLKYHCLFGSWRVNYETFQETRTRLQRYNELMTRTVLTELTIKILSRREFSQKPQCISAARYYLVV